MYRNIQFAHWWQQGHKFGYPQCCIREFIQMTHIDEPERKLSGTGYIPCKWCNENRTEEQMVNTINFNRCESLKPFEGK